MLVSYSTPSCCNIQNEHARKTFFEIRLPPNLKAPKLQLDMQMIFPTPYPILSHPCIIFPFQSEPSYAVQSFLSQIPLSSRLRLLQQRQQRIQRPHTPLTTQHHGPSTRRTQITQLRRIDRRPAHLIDQFPRHTTHNTRTFER